SPAPGAQSHSQRCAALPCAAWRGTRRFFHQGDKEGAPVTTMFDRIDLGARRPVGPRRNARPVVSLGTRPEQLASYQTFFTLRCVRLGAKGLSHEELFHRRFGRGVALLRGTCPRTEYL